MMYQNYTLVFLSACDNKIHVYQILEKSSEKTFDFNFLNSLQGHDNKVRSIDTSVLKNGIDGFIVSASKDMYIKVWRLVGELSEQIKSSLMKKNIYR